MPPRRYNSSFRSPTVDGEFSACSSSPTAVSGVFNSPCASNVAGGTCSIPSCEVREIAYIGGDESCTAVEPCTGKTVGVSCSGLGSYCECSGTEVRECICGS